MFKNFNKKKGQSTLEYAVLIVIIIAALLAMNQYIKRGLQGRLKSATDDIGDQFSVGNTNSLHTTHTVGQTKDTFAKGFAKSSIVTEGSTITLNQNVLNVDQEFWGKTP